jgi:hypothetical protein
MLRYRRRHLVSFLFNFFKKKTQNVLQPKKAKIKETASDKGLFPTWWNGGIAKNYNKIAILMN